MQIKTLDIGDRTKILIGNIGGQLRVRPGPAGQLEARWSDDDQLELALEEDQTRLSCDGECHLVVPPEASLEAEVIGGNLAVQDLEGELMARTVGGSLRLRRTGSVAVEQLGGGLSARQLSGGLSVDSVGGDALVDQVAGDLRLRAVGGDLRVSRVAGVVDVAAGGDGKLSLEPAGDKPSSVSVGGDLVCSVPEAASAHFAMQIGGDCRLAVPVQAIDTPSGCEVTLGDGKPEIRLASGGDLVLRAGSEDDELVAADLGEAIAMRVGAELETHMAEIEDRLTGLGDELQGFDSERIRRKIRSSIAKAQRKAARAQRRANHLRDLRVERPTPGASGAPSDEERLMILRMLEQGKISVDEAETLLQALES